MKKLILIAFVALFSCVQENKVEEKKEQLSKVEEPVLRFDNPSVFVGTNFVSFMQSCYKTGNFEMMLKYTDSSSLSFHGKEKIDSFYRKAEFAYDIKLISVKKQENGEYLMFYKTSIMASKAIKIFRVVVENDTCRIKLSKDLKTIEI